MHVVAHSMGNVALLEGEERPSQPWIVMPLFFAAVESPTM
jgi:hypothetical protein